MASPPSSIPRRPALSPTAPPGPAVQAQHLGIRPKVRSLADEGREQVQPIGAALAHQVPVVQVDRPALLDDGCRGPPDRLDPRRELLRVRYGRREAHQVDLGS